MSPDRPGGRISPEQVDRASFALVRRGFDPDQVRQLLAELAAELRDQRDREAALRNQVEALDARLTGDVSALDEGALMAALGEETARVLTAAREAATEIRAKGEESVARMLREAQDDAGRMRSEAESVLRERTAVADEAAAKVTAAAEERAAAMGADAAAAAQSTRSAAEEVLADARAAAEGTRASALEAAEAELEKAREEGRGLVQEAQVVRERVLKDLARKRKAARAQLEQLRAGRERLLEAYEVVRRTLGEATGELATSLTEAKLAADAAVRRVDDEPEATTEELEAEVEAARLAGLPIVGRGAEQALEPDVEPAEEAPPAAAPEPAPAPGAPVADELPPLPDEIPPPLPTLDPITPPKGRRKRGVPNLPPTELQPMSPRDPVEGMRVITGEVPVVMVESATDDVPVEVEVDVTELVVVAEGEVVADVIVAEVHEITDASDEIDGEDGVDVDDLFARMRAARADEVEKAHEILDEAAGTTAAEDAVEPAAEAEAEADVEAEEEAEPAALTDDEALLERRDALTDEIERRAVRKLKRVLADEQSEVLDLLRRTRSPSVDALFADGLEAQLARWGGVAGPELEEAVLAGATFHGNTKGATRSADDLGLELATAIVEPLREKVEVALRDSGGDEEAAADGIRAAYREWKSKRLAEATRDAVVGAFSRGLYDAAPKGTAMRWLVDDGDDACPDCDDDALGGAITKGDAFPTGHQHPPAHPGCRCLLVPSS